MAKYNVRGVRPKATTYVKTNEVSDTKTFNGGAGFSRDAKSELFLLGVSSFNEDTFYESAGDRQSRLVELVKTVVKEDPEWLVGYTGWLRGTANIRSVAIAIALEGAKAMIDQGVEGSRKLVASVLQRADEPAEAVAYWHSKYGRKLPAPVKRGIADAVKSLYNERSIFKYDSDSKAIRFADVIQLTHPSPKDAKQSVVFKFALDRRYNSKAVAPAELTIATARAEVKGLTGSELRELANKGKLTEYLRKSGMTWEALSSVIQGGMDAKAWEAVIPVMGYMALLRNLRNFINAGVSTKVLDEVANKIANQDEVAKSRQLPFRFWSAYKETSNSNQFKLAIERAFDGTLANVPVLKGKTLILVDMSGSMFCTMSGKSDINRSDAAALFGAALALRAEKADLVVFGSSHKAVSFRKGDSVLELKRKLTTEMGGTNLGRALQASYNGHDRVIILTDEQYDTWAGYSSYYDSVDPATIVPDKPIFIWNLAGYKPAGTGKPNVYTSGGLSDAAFGFIDMVDRANNADWPWLAKA